jgi:prepilin-type N-terminal cleavage/methylation domain-containing protein
MERAFTLPELMLGIAVTGILLGIAVPPLSQAVDRIEVQAAASHLIAAHQRGRIMAVARGQVLTLTIDSAALTISPGFPGGAGPPLHLCSRGVHPRTLQCIPSPRPRFGHTYRGVLSTRQSADSALDVERGKGDGPFSVRRARRSPRIRATPRPLVQLGLGSRPFGWSERTSF